MIKNGVWKNKTLSQLPYGRQGIGTKWVFKKKKEGTYQARMVAKGYTQEAGIDFTYNFAPVVGDTTLRIMLVLWIIGDYYAEVMDVQTAFLHGRLWEELFLEIPKGYREFMKERGHEVKGEYVKLEKSLYGLVQAA